MENDKKEIVVPFGGNCPELDFNVSDFQKEYLLNGSYQTRNPDGSARTPTNDYLDYTSNYYKK